LHKRDAARNIYVIAALIFSDIARIWCNGKEVEGGHKVGVNDNNLSSHKDDTNYIRVVTTKFTAAAVADCKMFVRSLHRVIVRLYAVSK